MIREIQVFVPPEEVFAATFKVTNMEANPNLFKQEVACGVCLNRFKKKAKPFIHAGENGRKHAFHKDCVMPLVDEYVKSNKKELFCAVCQATINKKPIVERHLVSLFIEEKLGTDNRELAKTAAKCLLGFILGVYIGHNMYSERPATPIHLLMTIGGLCIFAGTLFSSSRSFGVGIGAGIVAVKLLYKG